MFTKKNLIFLAILFFAMALLPKTSDALEVTPAIREISLTPGQDTSVMLELENDELEALQFTTEVVNFTAKDESGEPKYLEDATPTGAASWTDVVEGPVAIQPGDTAEVVVTFKTPSTAQAGGHYVGILFGFSRVDAAANGSQLTIESKVGVPILITVAGSYTQSGTISSFTTEGNKTSFAEGPVDFNIRFQNTGEVHLKPTGNVVITSMFGSEVATLAVNESVVAVLPDSTRSFEVASWTDFGSAFGKYTAKVTLKSGTVTDTATVDFWVLSTLGIVIAVAVVVVIIIVLILIIKAATKKKPETPVSQ